MNTHITRRSFLGATGTAVSAALLGSSFLSVGKILAATPLVRRNVGGLSASHSIIVSYRRAIRAMKALPTSNPLSWTYQAAIHGNTILPPLPGWNSCQHGTYFF